MFSPIYHSYRRIIILKISNIFSFVQVLSTQYSSYAMSLFPVTRYDSAWSLVIKRTHNTELLFCPCTHCRCEVHKNVWLPIHHPRSDHSLVLLTLTFYPSYETLTTSFSTPFWRFKLIQSVLPSRLFLDWYFSGPMQQHEYSCRNDARPALTFFASVPSHVYHP